jgi:hypothetical protein
MLSSNLRLCLPSGLFPSGFRTKTLYKHIPSPIRSICPTYLIIIDFVSRTTYMTRCNFTFRYQLSVVSHFKLIHKDKGDWLVCKVGNWQPCRYTQRSVSSTVCLEGLRNPACGIHIPCSHKFLFLLSVMLLPSFSLSTS